MSTSSSPDPSTKGFPSWLIFLIAIFGPPAAFLPFAHSITQNSLSIAFILIGYEVLVFMGGFVGKVWLKLENPLVDHFAEWIQLQGQRRFSPYRKHYCDYLTYEHQVFDIKGLSTRTAHDLELEQVFVELSLDATPAHQASTDPLSVPASLRQGGHAIWDFLSSASLGNPHLVIIGAPGSGKTTLLKHIALALAQQKKELHPINLSQTLPILLFLRDQVSSLQNTPDFSLGDAVQKHMQRKWHSSIPASWIEYHLRHGQCLVMLDGLDEVADAASRRKVVDWVQQQMVAYGNNRFLLTSRPYGYRDNPLDGVTVLEVHPFTSKQIERFIQRWYLANELKSWEKEDPGVHLRAREGAEDLLQRLQRVPALLELAVNPLLLTMIATVHRYRSSLPGKRVALYAEICDVFLGKRQEARGITQELTAVQKQQVLQPLAYALMQRGEREITYEDAVHIIASPLALVNAQMEPKVFLQAVENTSGIFLERNPGIYGFAHLTFQEYLAAVHVEKEKDEQILVAHVGDSWWHETIRLYSAQSDASTLIAACLRGNPPSIPALTLALECQQEALKIQPEVRTQLEMLLEQGSEDIDPERRHLVAEALLARRLREMVPLSEMVYRDTSLVTCAEYQLFLDEQRTQNIFCQPDHWQSAMFRPGKGRMSVLGVRQADARAFCDWLNERSAGVWHYRLPEKSEWTEKETEERQIEGIGYWTQQGGEFIWLRHPPRSLMGKIDQLFFNDYNLLLLSTFINTLASASESAHTLTRDLVSTSAYYRTTAALPHHSYLK
jgi:energy-coupling factor transporter ATP-binding protein EcfA2